MNLSQFLMQVAFNRHLKDTKAHESTIFRVVTLLETFINEDRTLLSYRCSSAVHEVNFMSVSGQTEQLDVG